MSRLARHGQWAAVAALALGYALLAHYTNITSDSQTLGTLLALAPLAAAALTLAWHSARRSAMLAALCMAAALLVAGWSAIAQHYSRIYWLEHAGSQLLLCLMFGRTLVAGRQPLCTGFAIMVQGTLSPAIERYTRQVTIAWTLFFGLMAAGSTALFFLAPLAAWSAFANFLTAPLIALMFVVEYGVRRRLHPHIEHAHFLDGIKAFWKAPAR